MPQALATGVVNAFMTSGSTGYDSKAWETMSHYYNTQAWIPKNVTFVNKAAFDAIPAARFRLDEWNETCSAELPPTRWNLRAEASASVDAPVLAATARRTWAKPITAETTTTSTNPETLGNFIAQFQSPDSIFH